MPTLVPVSELRTGMYVHDLNCGWLDHPFARNRFLIDDAETLARIRQLPISTVWVDLGRSRVQPTAQSAAPAAVAEEPATHEATPVVPDEREYARRIREQATRAVEEAMNRCRLGRALELGSIARVVEDMVDSLERHQHALTGLCRLRMRDSYTFEHSVNVGILASAVGKAMGMTRRDLRELALGGLLHDVGKARTPLRILNKPGRLSDTEFAIMRRHVNHGENIAAELPCLPASTLQAITQHHERLDGSGYPLGLKGDQIGMVGRIIAACDVYDAMTADRCYRDGREPIEVLRMMLQWCDTGFDTTVVHHLIRCVGVYPVGTLVRMASNKLAMVMQPGEKGLLHPVVRVFYDIERQLHLGHHDIDLSQVDHDHIVGTESAEQWSLAPELVPQPE